MRTDGLWAKKKKLAAAGIRTKELAFYNKHGPDCLRPSRAAAAAGYSWTQIQFRAAIAQDPSCSLRSQRPGAAAIVKRPRLTHFEQRGDTVIARFADPSAGRSARRGRIRIGKPTASFRRAASSSQGREGGVRRYLHYRVFVEPRPSHRQSMAVWSATDPFAAIVPIGDAESGGKV